MRAAQVIVGSRLDGLRLKVSVSRPASANAGRSLLGGFCSIRSFGHDPISLSAGDALGLLFRQMRTNPAGTLPDLHLFSVGRLHVCSIETAELPGQSLPGRRVARRTAADDIPAEVGGLALHRHSLREFVNQTPRCPNGAARLPSLREPHVLGEQTAQGAGRLIAA